jgi:hypothetical protein
MSDSIIIVTGDLYVSTRIWIHYLHNFEVTPCSLLDPPSIIINSLSSHSAVVSLLIIELTIRIQIMMATLRLPPFK